MERARTGPGSRLPRELSSAVRPPRMPTIAGSVRGGPTDAGRQLLRTTRSGSPGFQIVTSIAPSTISTDDAPVRSAT